MDSGSRTIGGVKLETIVYIGIAADIVLAVVVGVLIVWWRNKSKKRQEAKLQAARDAAADSRSDWATDGSVTPRQVDRPTGQDQVNHRLASERMVSRSVRTEYTDVEADFGFLDDNQSGKSQTSGRVVSGPPPHVVGASETRVSFHDVVNSEGQGGGAYTVANDERVVHNPLSGSRKIVGTFEEEPTDEQQVAKSVYYTYNDPPTLQPSRDDHAEAYETGVSSPEYSQPQQTSSTYEREVEERHGHAVVSESVTYVETRKEEETDEHHVAKSVYYHADVDETGAPPSPDYLQHLNTSSAYEMEDEERHEHAVVRESVASVDSIPASPPPPPPPPPQQVEEAVFVHEELRTSTTNHYSTLDSHVKVVQTEGDEVLVSDMSEWAKMNFGYEEPEKRYIIQLEECTEVM
ncbi:uncharacterized protein LOC124279490 [Haliotis rubra]|uniref:uncharacterized protein LOC124279490 n=1 Tax=Haliotis rubra TaxID=36100 RepID=UPI001EE56BC9|nr:uncharacterized protein LOC124279490 [Haliotis rubra]XP_046571268.1 uncharacterized protein LOC124279490 [Haliotis rubra]XP_046571269.1 uncharacterized protein LOC124279490 [Haliotis rubra]